MEATAIDAAVLEIERFEWVTPERIEIAGYWSGLRGRRFMRPTLVLKGEGEPKRLLALLEHKPWGADEGEEWIAAFAWKGEVLRFDSAEMNVGSGIDLELPPPRMRPGKPRRFRQRVAVRDASRDVEAVTPRAKGIVSDTPAKDAAPKKAAAPAKPKAEAAAPAKPAFKPAEPEPTQALPAADAAPEAPAEDLTGRVEALEADLERMRTQREELRRERDKALERLRTVRAEMEAERQAREKAIADARSEERESANRMLGEGAELRAAVERQREIAYLERDDATRKRDEAVTARDNACEERDRALAEAKEARRQRKEAFAQRDRAVNIRAQAEAERDEALLDREEAISERDAAVKERDEVVSVYERGLPVKEPKPRFLPEEHDRRSDLDVWGPRASAIGVLVLCAFIVLRLFACG